MVIDTSALAAILLGEPEAEAIAKAIARDNKRLISAFSLLETCIVIEARKGEKVPGTNASFRIKLPCRIFTV